MLLSWKFLLIKEPWKICITCSIDALSSKMVFNIDNTKTCFLNSQSAYQNPFWRIMKITSEDNLKRLDFVIILLFYYIFHQITVALVRIIDKKILETSNLNGNAHLQSKHICNSHYLDTQYKIVLSNNNPATKYPWSIASHLNSIF